MDLDYNFRVKKDEPPDNGYYYSFVTYENRFIKIMLEENGFVEIDNLKASIIWNCGVVNNKTY